MPADQSPPSGVRPPRVVFRLPWRLQKALDLKRENLARLLADRRVLNTPPCPTGHDNPNFEIHVLLGKRHVGMTLWAVKSLLHWTGKAYRVVLHDDGSLSEKDVDRLRAHLPESRVIRRADADRMMAEILSAFPNAYAYRFSRLGSAAPQGAASIFSLKLLDFGLLSKAAKILVLDSDVLFFGRPDAIVEWVNDVADIDCMYCFEMYVPIRNARNQIIRFEQRPSPPTGFNSGLICLERAALDLALLDEWLGRNRELSETVYVFEQLAYNHLVKRWGRHRPLPDTYSFNFNAPGCAATHFGIKPLFFKNLPRVYRALMSKPR